MTGALHRARVQPGQFFWDFRNTDAQDYWAEKVCLEGAMHPDVDGMFTDDPGGYGQEHGAVQSAVQLSDDEIVALQLGTQRSWMKALALLTKAKKYIPQAYRTTPPFLFNATEAGVASCTAWMQHQCATPANESTQTYPQATGSIDTAKMAVAAFLARALLVPQRADGSHQLGGLVRPPLPPPQAGHGQT